MSAQPRFSDDDGHAWWVQVQGQAYGPYPPAQMRAFVEEGRVKPHTLVSVQREGGWRAAKDAGLIDNDHAAHVNDAPPPVLRGPSEPVQDDARLSNMAIWGELPGGGEDHVQRTLEAFGASARVGANLWVLRTVHPVSAVRAAIASGLSVGERCLVIDASRGRLAWSNLGLDSESSLRRVWDAKG